MAEIIPAILPKSYDEVEDKLDLVAGHASRVQIDICDGSYVPNRTWPYLKAHQDDQIFEAIVGQDQALPHWEDTDVEFDLMVKKPYEKIPDFISAGASRIVVHKASMSADELNDVVRDYGKHSEELGPFDVELGLGLPFDAKPEDVKPYVADIHFVQVMGIRNVGFQGQSFDPQAIETVRALRQAFPELIISVDGGVNLDTGKELVEAGVDRLVVGSAIFGSDNPLETLQSFEAL